MSRRTVIEEFDIEMHFSPRLRCFTAIRIPPRLDFLFRLTVIFTLGPARTRHHLIDDPVRIELLEMGVVPSGHTGICNRRIPVDGVDMGPLIELDPPIAWMRVLGGEELEWVGRHGDGFDIVSKHQINFAVTYMR